MSTAEVGSLALESRPARRRPPPGAPRLADTTLGAGLRHKGMSPLTRRMVELIFDRTCPNLGAAREESRAAPSRVGLPARWGEWDRVPIVAALLGGSTDIRA